MGGNLGTIFVSGAGNNLFKHLRLYDEPIANPHADYNVTNKDQTDYFLAFSGSNNIAVDIITENYQPWISTPLRSDDAPGGHGVGVRGGYQWKNGGSHYNLIDDVHTLNMTEGLYIRNSESNFNVIKNSSARRESAMIDGKPDYHWVDAWVGVSLWGGVDNNVVENVSVTNMSVAIDFPDNGEDDSPSKHIGSNNIIRNSIFHGFKKAVQIWGDYESTDVSQFGTANGNKVINVTFDSGYTLFNPNFVTIDSFEFTNCQVTNFNNPDETIILPPDNRGQTEKAIFENCNFHNNTTNETANWKIKNEGVNSNNLNMDPQYEMSTDFHLNDLSPVEVREGGKTSVVVKYDFEGNERTAPYSIGAYELDTE